MRKTCLVCLLGRTPAVVYELIAWLNDSDLHNIKQKPQEIWLVGTDFKEDEKFCKSMQSLYEYLEKQSLSWRRFIILNTHDVHNKIENENIAEGILRVLLLAKETFENGQIWINLAGGRKTMASYGHMGQMLVPVSRIFHVIAERRLEKMSMGKENTLAKLIAEWQTIKNDVHPVEIPTLEGWDCLFRQFFLGLGKNRKLQYDCYPLESKELPQKNSTKKYTIPQNPKLLESFNLVSRNLGSFLSLSEGISFSVFQHDLRDFLTILVQCDQKETRQKWVDLLNTYSDSLDQLGKSLEIKNGVSYLNCDIEEYLWKFIVDVVSILDKKLIADVPKKIWKYKFSRFANKEVVFEINTAKQEGLVPERKYLFSLLRNLLKNMLEEGCSKHRCSINCTSDMLIIETQNSVTSKQLSFLQENENKLGIPGVKKANQKAKEGRGLGLYAIRLAVEILMSGELNFVIPKKKNEFKVQAKIPIKPVPAFVSDSVDILCWDHNPRNIPYPNNCKYEQVKNWLEFEQKAQMAKYICIHASELDFSNKKQKQKISTWINQKPCFFYSNSENDLGIKSVQESCIHNLNLCKNSYGKKAWQVLLLSDLENGFLAKFMKTPFVLYDFTKEAHIDVCDFTKETNIDIYNRIYHFDPENKYNLMEKMPMPQRICNSYFHFTNQEKWQQALEQHKQNWQIYYSQRKKIFGDRFISSSVPRSIALVPDAYTIEKPEKITIACYPKDIDINIFSDVAKLRANFICFWQNNRLNSGFSKINESYTQPSFFEGTFHELKYDKWLKERRFFEQGLWQMAKIEWLMEHDIHASAEVKECFFSIWKCFSEHATQICREILELSLERHCFKVANLQYRKDLSREQIVQYQQKLWQHCPKLAMFWNEIVKNAPFDSWCYIEKG